MPDFFDQMNRILADEARRRPGYTAPEELVSALAPTSARPPLRRTAPVAAPAPVAAITPRSPAAPAAASTATFVPGKTLDELCRQVQTCDRCVLCQKRNHAVFGEGDPNADLMFIGEGPGFEEDRQGRPFVGAAGQLLDKMIAAMQFTREEVYIANIVKCRPPNNRAPMPDEAAACITYLKKQIELISPKVIVLLGATAAGFLLERREGISRLRGRWLEYSSIPVMPTFHPAFLLRQESAKRDAWEDLKKVMLVFGKTPTPPRRSAR